MNGRGFFKRWLGGNEGSAQTWRQARQGLRMLVVDDSPTICAVLGRMLEQGGYAVRQAADGERALELAKAEAPELIFLDIVLPGINGFAVLRALRHDPRTAHIPVVMISGNPQATEQFYAQRFGADDFIRKPFGRDDVMGSLEQPKARSANSRLLAGTRPQALSASAGGCGGCCGFRSG